MKQFEPAARRDTASQTDTASSDFFVKSLERGLAVIRCFDAEHPRQTLAETAKIAGISRASARRYLFTLEALGYMESDGKYFWLSPKVLALGYSYLSTQSLKEVAEPYLRELSAAVGESVSLSVLDDDCVVYIARSAARQIMTLAISVGTRLPAATTSMGRVLIAGMDDEQRSAYLSGYFGSLSQEQSQSLSNSLESAWRDGFVIVDQELEVGLRALAVPIKDEKGQTVAAINVSTRVGTRNAEFDVLKEQILPRLVQTATEISEAYKHRDGSFSSR